MNHRSTTADTFESIAEPFCTSQTLVTIIDNTKNVKAYFDLTGPFPYVSTRGYKYIFVPYNYNSNAILTETIKTKSTNDI